MVYHAGYIKHSALLFFTTRGPKSKLFIYCLKPEIDSYQAIAKSCTSSFLFLLFNWLFDLCLFRFRFTGSCRFRKETLSTSFARWIKTGMKGSIMEESAFSHKAT